MSSDKIFLGFASIPVLGIAAQWFAWRFKLPAILILLLTGFIVGPITHFVRPDAMFGELLFPFVSVAVAIIIFEGGLSLKFSELRGYGTVVANLVTIGVLLSWMILSTAAYTILNYSPQIAILIGAVLVMTGPTVVLPLLRTLRLKKELSSVLRWEGIIIDPVVAVLAVLIFEVIVAGGLDKAWGIAALFIIKTLFFGISFGILGALLLILIFERHWCPEYLHESLTLMLVIGMYSLSNIFQIESGLLAVTVMGIVLANQKIVVVKHIVTFKENLTLLLLSSLFIILAARLDLADFLTLFQSESGHYNSRSLWFIVVAVFIGRPISVLVSTMGSSLSLKERFFMCWMAPRGIVCASISSLFAIRLQALGYEGADQLVSLSFLMIFVTVVLYGLTGGPVSRFLHLVQARRLGLVIVGGQEWAIELASILKKKGLLVLLVDTNKAHIISAKEEGVPVLQGSVLADTVKEEIELGGYGKLMTLTSSDELNLLTVNDYLPILGRVGVYRLWPVDKTMAQSVNAQAGKVVFGKGTTYPLIDARYTSGARVRAITLKKTLTFEDLIKKYPRAIPLCVLTQKKTLLIFNHEKPLSPHPGQTVVCLISNLESA